MKHTRNQANSRLSCRSSQRTGTPSRQGKLGNPINKLTLIYIPTAIAYVLLATTLLTRGAPEGASANPEQADAPAEVITPYSEPTSEPAVEPVESLASNSGIQTSQVPAIDSLAANSAAPEQPAPSVAQPPAVASAPSEPAPSTFKPIVSGPFRPSSAAVARSQAPQSISTTATPPSAPAATAAPPVAPAQAAPATQARSNPMTPVPAAQVAAPAATLTPPNATVSPASTNPSPQSPTAALPASQLKQQNTPLYASKQAGLLAQDAAPAPAPAQSPPSADVIQDLKNRLNLVGQRDTFGNVFEGSPSLSVANPTGFGADNFTAFLSGTYQERTRFGDEDDGALGIGIGLGDARKAVGVELSYTFASFGTNRDFGTGGFNLKVHRQFSEDFAVAVGWNGFITIGDDFNDDFKDSVYGVATKIFRLQPSLDAPFSRVALNLGVGSGQFRLEEDVRDDDDTVNVFGGVAVRVVRPVSAIVEWTGQDLAVGLSIVPFKNQSFVITPAVRDITGAGDGARFVLGFGFAYQF